MPSDLGEPCGYYRHNNMITTQQYFFRFDYSGKEFARWEPRQKSFCKQQKQFKNQQTNRKENGKNSKRYWRHWLCTMILSMVTPNTCDNFVEAKGIAKLDVLVKLIAYRKLMH